MPTFKPNYRLVARVVPSPNHGARRKRARPDMIVLHYTGMKRADAALKALCSRDTQVSSHYLVFEDGRIYQLVPETRRAWHAGLSSWGGVTDINSRSIGIEIANPGHDFGYPRFPKKQIDAVIALCRDIVKRRRIRRHRVLAHSDIAPARKNDPGEKFPWARLAKARVGLWIKPAPIRRGSVLKLGSRGAAVEELQRLLADYGYDVTVSGRYDHPTKIVVAAFQRHFRPARVDGVADRSSVDTLRRLLRARHAARA